MQLRDHINEIYMNFDKVNNVIESQTNGGVMSYVQR